MPESHESSGGFESAALGWLSVCLWRISIWCSWMFEGANAVSGELAQQAESGKTGSMNLTLWQTKNRGNLTYADNFESGWISVLFL